MSGMSSIENMGGWCGMAGVTNDLHAGIAERIGLISPVALWKMPFRRDFLS
jgi:hypothetical protein